MHSLSSSSVTTSDVCMSVPLGLGVLNLFQGDDERFDASFLEFTLILGENVNYQFGSVGVLAFLFTFICHYLEFLGDTPTIQFTLSSNSRIQRSCIIILSSLGFFSVKKFSFGLFIDGF